MHREGAAAQERTGERLACTFSYYPLLQARLATCRRQRPSLPLSWPRHTGMSRASLLMAFCDCICANLLPDPMCKEAAAEAATMAQQGWRTAPRGVLQWCKPCNRQQQQ